MNTHWYQKSVNALTLAGKGGRTVEAYARALRVLVEFHGKEPASITEAELETYFLHRRNVDRWSPNTMRICYCGIRFFFVSVFGHDWRLFQYLRARAESRLSAALPGMSAQVWRGLCAATVQLLLSGTANICHSREGGNPVF